MLFAIISGQKIISVVSVGLDTDENAGVCVFLFFFFFLERPAFLFDFVCQCTVHSSKISGGQCTPVGPMHYLGTHKPYFSKTFSLKMGPTALFTHLKIILL